MHRSTAPKQATIHHHNGPALGTLNSLVPQLLAAAEVLDALAGVVMLTEEAVAAAVTPYSLVQLLQLLVVASAVCATPATAHMGPTTAG